MGGGSWTTAQRTPSTPSTEYQSRSARTSAARSDWRVFDGSRTGAIAANPDFSKGQGASLICIADDAAHAAVDENLCGSLKVGGGVADCVGALCARDYKGPCADDVESGKLICERIW